MSNTNSIKYTAADAFNDALVNAGVDCIFINSGTDYPAIIESWAKYEAEGRMVPRIIICPHEYAAMSAAQGYAQITGRAAGVFVHVDVGTQNLGGAVHNAFRCRVPVFIFAGISPYTMEGEHHAGRNHYIQFVQNAADQDGIVRGYTKLNYEYRSGKNIQQMTYRALQLAHSEPMGPVYMTAAREVLAEDGVDIGADMRLWNPVAPAALDDESISIVVQALSKAKKPIIITAYSGRNPKCVEELVKFADKMAIPVIETNEMAYMNFPGDHPMHAGFEVRGFIEHADVALIIDCDLPWIPAYTKPKAECRIFSIDSDPLKEDIPLWYLRAERFMQADSYTAVRQLRMELERIPFILDKTLIETRRERITEIHNKMRAEWVCEDIEEGLITPQFLTKCVKEIINDDTILLNETITVRSITDEFLPRNKPGTLFGNGGSSLGWHGGAAVGMKLACPDKDIVALTGDGTYIFSCPTAVYWMAKKYDAPFMTIIYNNQGWNAPKQFTARQYPEGHAVSLNEFYASFAPSAQLDMVAAAAGDAFARTVTDAKDLRKALSEGREAVKNGQCAVINVMIDAV